MTETLTPARIVQELDKYIIGQHNAKRAVAIALRNRWRRMQAPDDMRSDIVPSNILMIGPTGVGKTEIARRLAQLTQSPFIKVEASKFTEVGYVGRDVESMVRDLVEQSVNMVKAEQKERVRTAALEAAHEALLNVLLPPVRAHQASHAQPDKDDIGYAVGDQDSKAAPADVQSEAALNERTRAKLAEKLRKGELDDRVVEVDVEVTSNVQVMGPAGVDGLDGLQDMIANMMPKRTRTRKMTVAEAREYFTDLEAQKRIDMDGVTREAILRAENSGIIFIDEIDKIASSGNRSGADVSREGVQRDLLPVVEGTVVNTKHGSVKTDHVLFIAAGAFHVAKPGDLIPELQGRFPIRVELSSLTEQDFVNILTQPRNALTRQYTAMLASEGVELSFDAEAIAAMARIAFQVNQEVENIGARRLHTIMSTLLNDILFDVPDLNRETHFVVSAEMVGQRLTHVAGNRDLSRYIL